MSERGRQSLARAPARFEESAHNPAIFADVANRRDLPRIYMTLSYSPNPEGRNETLSCSFRRVASKETAWPAITSFRATSRFSTTTLTVRPASGVRCTS